MLRSQGTLTYLLEVSGMNALYIFGQWEEFPPKNNIGVMQLALRL